MGDTEIEYTHCNSKKYYLCHLKIRIRVVHIWNNIEDYLLDKCDVEVDEATEELLGEGWPLVDVNDL